MVQFSNNNKERLIMKYWYLFVIGSFIGSFISIILVSNIFFIISVFVVMSILSFLYYYNKKDLED